MALQMQYWIKTQEAQEVIGSGRIFCIQGELLQGYKGGPMPVGENQITEEEMKAVKDIDDTMHRVWFKRKQRLESAFLRKQKEYDERAHIVRDEQEKTFQHMERREKLKLAPSPLDAAVIRRQDARLERLAQLRGEEELKRATMEADKKKTVPADKDPDFACTACGDACPIDHKSPAKWLTGHKLNCPTWKAQAATREAEAATG